jgi:hypothetical protein
MSLHLIIKLYIHLCLWHLMYMLMKNLMMLQFKFVTNAMYLYQQSHILSFQSFLSRTNFIMGIFQKNLKISHGLKRKFVPYTVLQPMSQNSVIQMTPKILTSSMETLVPTAHSQNVISTATVLPHTPADVNDMLSVVFVGPGSAVPTSSVFIRKKLNISSNG